MTSRASIIIALQSDVGNSPSFAKGANKVQFPRVLIRFTNSNVCYLPFGALARNAEF